MSSLSTTTREHCRDVPVLLLLLLVFLFFQEWFQPTGRWRICETVQLPRRYTRSSPEKIRQAIHDHRRSSRSRTCLAFLCCTLSRLQSDHIQFCWSVPSPISRRVHWSHLLFFRCLSYANVCNYVAQHGSSRSGKWDAVRREEKERVFLFISLLRFKVVSNRLIDCVFLQFRHWANRSCFSRKWLKSTKTTTSECFLLSQIVLHTFVLIRQAGFSQHTNRCASLKSRSVNLLL